MSNLTEQEQEVIDLSVKLWNEFLKLPIQHMDDNNEMRRDIHDIQNRIFSRPEIRNQMINKTYS